MRNTWRIYPAVAAQSDEAMKEKKKRGERVEDPGKLVPPKESRYLLCMILAHGNARDAKWLYEEEDWLEVNRMRGLQMAAEYRS